jgi:seryl-tRNA synthetase
MVVEIDKYELERLQWQLSKYKEKCADLEKQLDQEKDKSNHLQFRVDNELEPRIKQERESYDRWVTEDPGCRACECFESKLEDLIDFVDENKEMFDWDDSRGDLYCKILYLINNREDDEIYYIEDKENRPC